MKNSITKLTALSLASLLLLSGCENVTDRSNRNTHTNTDVEYNTSINYEDLERCSYDVADFNYGYHDYSFRLMSQVLANENSDTNVMISPASVMFAMDLVAAGANGDTLTQITDMFSEGAVPLEQQAFAASMMNRINGSNGVDFNCANAVWTNDCRMSSGLNPEYQQYVEDTFGAEAFQEPFSDSTVAEINSWISANTSGMIDSVLSDLSDETVAVLVNAIAFEGQWDVAYEDYQVQQMTFNTASGDDIDVNMLCDTMNTYFETDLATGTIRYYDGGEYAFIVILPTDESVSANEFLAGFTAEDYDAFIASRSYNYDVYSRIPEFDYDYDTSLGSVLQALGVEDAFDPVRADLTGIGFADSGNNIFISNVIHKTHIELDSEGTRAAAATVVFLEDACVEPEVVLTREVYCDRPFAYAIVDAETMNPIFLGTYNG